MSNTRERILLSCHNLGEGTREQLEPGAEGFTIRPPPRRKGCVCGTFIADTAFW